MKRLFIAVPILERSRKEIVSGIINNDALRRLPVRWSAERNLHLTLQFLGDVEENRIPLLKQIIDGSCSASIREPLCFSSVGAFPEKAAPRVLWIGIKTNNTLLKIQRSLTDALIGGGFNADRKKFRAHLTLGRVRENSPFPADGFDLLYSEAEKLRITDSPLDRVILFESRLQPGGPVYSAIYEKRLA